MADVAFVAGPVPHVAAPPGTRAEAARSGPGLVAALGLRRVLRSVRGTPRSPLQRRSRGGEAVTLEPEDQWIQRLNLEKFGEESRQNWRNQQLEGFEDQQEVHQLGQKLKASQDQKDMKHLHKMVLWNRICAVIGLGTMWMGAPNLISIIFLSLWTHSSWTMMGHHACHGGYNRTDATGRYSSRGFALGSVWRRLQDWFDWMLPEAWSVEHNQLHHYRLSEDGDPDLLERNSQDWNKAERLILPFVSMLLWKWAYYAPNTYKDRKWPSLFADDLPDMTDFCHGKQGHTHPKNGQMNHGQTTVLSFMRCPGQRGLSFSFQELKLQEMRNKQIPLPEGFDPQKPLTLGDLAAGQGKGVLSLRELFMKVMGPYFVFRFFLLPLPLVFFGSAFYFHGVCNLFLADILSNIHGFIVVVPNHAGKDLYRFQRHDKARRVPSVEGSIFIG
eukprot:Skav226074  [mRNA]  locus=scaffold211:890715:896176:- [translate_table: standard]